MKKILIICGPTGTGKTKLAVALAKTFRGELINADSRQVYVGLDALTGKDRSPDVPIWLYDIADGEFSVAHFVPLAQSAIEHIAQKRKLPIVVGGTGFYLRALVNPPETMAIPPDWARRKHLETLPVDTLQTLVDPARFALMNESDRKNPRRLIRATEVGSKISSQSARSYDALWIGLTAPLPLLKQRITDRVIQRFDAACREVRVGLPPILGTEVLLGYTRGEYTKEEALKDWAQAEYQYAKRQLTWFRKEKQVHWFDVSDPKTKEQIIDTVKAWYTSI